MPITFGSVGDIISISLLIKDVVKSLDNGRGSPAEYQAVIRELWSLDYALLQVEALLRSCERTVQLTALSVTVNECAEQCRKCITNFHEHVRKFGKCLQSGGSGSLIRDTAQKIRWQVSEKEELAKFRAEISAHCSSINMLLTTTGIALTKLNDQDLQAALKQSRSSYIDLAATHSSELAKIKSCLEENSALAKTTASETKALSSRFDMDYFKTLGADILWFMQKLWKVNCLTYKTVLSLQNSIPAQLDRCWTQEPATLEDALGRVTPVHMEFLDSWEAFEAVLEVRFRQLPGHRKIQRREYALRAISFRRDVGPFLAFNRCFLPGQRISMSMIFDEHSGSISSCPGCHQIISRPEEELDTEVQWCQMWYQRVIEIETNEPASMTMHDTQLSMPHVRKQQGNENEELNDNPAQFRRVRLRCWDQTFCSHKRDKDLRKSPEVFNDDLPSMTSDNASSSQIEDDDLPMTPRPMTPTSATNHHQWLETNVDGVDYAIHRDALVALHALDDLDDDLDDEIDSRHMESIRMVEYVERWRQNIEHVDSGLADVELAEVWGYKK